MRDLESEVKGARDAAAVGIRVKSGWGAVVVLGGTVADPKLLHAGRLELSDPADPFSKQPYRAAQNTLERDQRVIEARLEKIHAVTAKTVDELLEGGDKRTAVVLVVGSLRDPATVTSEHMRAHAFEGRTFWRVLRDVLGARGLDCQVFCEKDLPGIVAKKFAIPPDELRTKFVLLGRGITGWRAEQKLAAMGALVGLPGQ